MRTIRYILATLAVATLVIAPAVSAGAQTGDDYPATTPTSQVLGEGDEPDGGDGGDDGGVGGIGDQPGGDVAGDTAAPGGDTEVLSSGSSRLPVTGGDIVGLAVIGLAAIGIGTALVLRRRHAEI